jgi:hypothetical protein
MDIGRFHQRIFNYIEGCTVPKKGWDVVFKKDSGITLPDGSHVSTVHVEMKNKYNTTGKSSTYKMGIYNKMKNEISTDNDCACFLVEAIAEKSQNIEWEVSSGGTKQSDKRIRRVSIDEFYKLVTGQEDAFYQLCQVLPSVIEKVMVEFENESGKPVVRKDSAFDQLSKEVKSKGSFENALYSLAFNGYIGFPQETEKTFPQEVVKTSTD